MIKKGDAVRFLNAVGGGVVVRVDEAKKMLYVEDEDGFEIPVLERECVVVGTVNKDTNFPVKDFRPKTQEKVPESLPEVLKITPQTKAPDPILETPEGEELKVLLAILPIDIKQLQTTGYECCLINDSNYFLFYNMIIGEKEKKSIANGVLEPNTQEFITEISKEQLNDWEILRFQTIAYKQDKSYHPQNVIDSEIKINPVKFFKLQSFTENEYFDEPVMMLNVLTESERNKLIEISAEDIKKAMYQKEQMSRPRIVKPVNTSEVLEIDLHINELTDSTAGMSNGDMLQLQLDKFRSVIEENKNRKGKKIVFIHGKGEGVLRKEIETLLRTNFKNLYFQDASFREYGFGATMVTIR